MMVEQGDLSLNLQGIYNAGPGRTSFAAADFNGDGALDVAVDSPKVWRFCLEVRMGDWGIRGRLLRESRR
jgi:hypothetical protein